MRSIGFLVALLAPYSVLAQDDVYIDEGACPGEGCLYGEFWVASGPVSLLGKADSSAEVIATIDAGQTVQTLTGQVHTVPGRFDIRRAHNEFVPGDEVLVYTYLGEGWFRLRHNGELKEVDLNFSPWGGSGGTRCNNEARCWGSLQAELEFDWWVKIRADDAQEGWIINPSEFQLPAAPPRR